MKRKRRYVPSLDQAFMNSVREVLGQTPLYGEAERTEEERWQATMLRQGMHWRESRANTSTPVAMQEA